VTTPIYVWAVVTDERGILLLPSSETDGWTLPGGALMDDDDTVEAAIMRELRSRYGIGLPAEPEFLATRYERLPDGGTVVHNLFHIPTETLDTEVDVFGDSAEWTDPADTDRLSLPTWLREGLATLFEDEDALPSFDVTQLQAGLAQFRPAAPVVIVTGPAAAGKSTVARELCRRFDRAAHIDVDMIRWHMIVSGYVRPEEAYGPEPEEAQQQLLLAARNASALARNFADEGFLAVIDDVIETREHLDAYLDYLSGCDPISVVTLLPNADALAARDTGRPKDQYMGSRSEELRRIIAGNGETRGLRLDTSDWTAEETVDIILEQMGAARILPSWETEP
jgi:chloramphenicol 3-O-phosphotransferase/ADP-ribose pyrophosphatase YjhB (NUDIX family)